MIGVGPVGAPCTRVWCWVGGGVAGGGVVATGLGVGLDAGVWAGVLAGACTIVGLGVRGAVATGAGTGAGARTTGAGVAAGRGLADERRGDVDAAGRRGARRAGAGGPAAAASPSTTRPGSTARGGGPGASRSGPESPPATAAAASAVGMVGCVGAIAPTRESRPGRGPDGGQPREDDDPLGGAVEGLQAVSTTWSKAVRAEHATSVGRDDPMASYGVSEEAVGHLQGHPVAARAELVDAPEGSQVGRAVAGDPDAPPAGRGPPAPASTPGPFCSEASSVPATTTRLAPMRGIRNRPPPARPWAVC